MRFLYALIMRLLIILDSLSLSKFQTFDHLVPDRLTLPICFPSASFHCIRSSMICARISIMKFLWQKKNCQHAKFLAMSILNFIFLLKIWKWLDFNFFKHTSMRAWSHVIIENLKCYLLEFTMWHAACRQHNGSQRTNDIHSMSHFLSQKIETYSRLNEKHKRWHYWKQRQK